jgi:glutaredoxin-like protein
MTIIADRDRSTVQNLLARELVEDVELLLFTCGRVNTLGPERYDGQSSAETRELLEQVVELSDRLHLTTYDLAQDESTALRYNVAAAPTVIVRRREPATDADGGEPRSGTNVRFVGLPGGYEFSTLIADIVDVSQSRTDLSAHALGVVQAIDVPVLIQVFVTPSCPYCPRAVRLAHHLAMANPLIVAEAVEANEFQDLSERYGVRTVPKTVINGRIEFVGSLPEANMLEALLEAVGSDE